jgi:hypothetical protein
MSTQQTFDSWELQARLALAKENINWDIAGPLIEDAKQHWQASGQDPWSACGDPDEFAAAAAAEQPPERKAALDQEGLTARGYLTDMFFVLNVLIIPWSLLAAVVTGSWSFTLTPARLAGGVLFVATFIVLFGLPRAIRTSGRPRQAPWALVPILALMAVTVAAAEQLPDTALFTVPVWAFDVAAVVLILMQLGPAKRTPAASDPEVPSSMSNDEWLRRLNGLLIGRHDLPAHRAAELVAQAGEHAGAGSVVEEFGPAEVYAAEIAEGETVRQFPAWIQSDKVAFLLFALVLGHEQLTGRFGDQRIWITLASVIAVLGVMLLGAAWLLVRHGRRPTTETTETTE